MLLHNSGPGIILPTLCSTVAGLGRTWIHRGWLQPLELAPLSPRLCPPHSRQTMPSAAAVGTP